MLTYSSGNHGQALALAASTVDTTATVVVPEDIPDVKRAAIEGYGSRVVTCGTTSTDRYEKAVEIAAETGALIVPPFDHPDIIAGQGTTGLEIIEEMPTADVVLVPVGGGGLLAGISIAAAGRNPGTRVFGVEPHDANGMALSLAAGEIVSLSRAPQTIADGLRPMAPGRLTFAAADQFVAGILCVSDDAIREAQQLILERAKLLVEPSGAAGVAALLEHGDQLAGLRTAVVLTGGNMPVPRLAP